MTLNICYRSLCQSVAVLISFLKQSSKNKLTEERLYTYNIKVCSEITDTVYNA